MYIRSELEPVTATYVRVLCSALASLSQDQQRIARSNSRRKVFKALKHIRKDVERSFPAIRLDGGRVRTAGKTPRQLYAMRKARLEKRGYRVMSSAGGGSEALLAAFAQARVRVVRLENGPIGLYYAPLWALTVGTNVDRLIEARRSPNVRKALLANYLLSNAESAP